MAADAEPSGWRWYCYRYAPQHEIDAGAALTAAGYTTCLPGEMIERVERGQRSRLRPLFPGYSFVRLDLSRDWRGAAHVKWVMRIMGSRPDRPTPLPVGWVEALIERMRDDGVVTSGPGIVRPRAPIPHGARVHITDGALAGADAVCEMSSEDRVVALVTFFGARRRVVVARDCVLA